MTTVSTTGAERRTLTLGSSKRNNPSFYEFDITVFIGRMRPVSKAHLASVKRALRDGYIAVVIIGSTNQARSPRTPFYEEEVEEMLRLCLNDEENARLRVCTMRDMYNSALWVDGVRRAVRSVAETEFPDVTNPEVALVGHFKDDRTSDYLKRFKGWDFVEVGNIDGLSMTDFRNMFWEDRTKALTTFKDSLPAQVLDFLDDVAAGDMYDWLVREHRAYTRNNEEYAKLRYKPTFHAADPVVVQDDHVLMIKRDLLPGMGLLSLPGAMVQADETIDEAIFRSIYEKTKLKVPRRIVEPRVTATHVFDYPWRSERGRIISTAKLIELGEEELPKVSAGRGASKAFWIPISEIPPREVFEDHLRIIETMVSMSKKQF